MFRLLEIIQDDHNPPEWLEPEGLHSVENIDDRVYEIYRIELKNK